MNDKKCYVCQKDILKKYVCKDCYFELVRENEQLKNRLSTIVQQSDKSPSPKCQYDSKLCSNPDKMNCKYCNIKKYTNRIDTLDIHKIIGD